MASCTDAKVNVRLFLLGPTHNAAEASSEFAPDLCARVSETQNSQHSSTVRLRCPEPEQFGSSLSFVDH